MTPAALKIHRAKLRAAGLCRECQKPSDGKLRCSLCQRKKSLPELPAWQATKQALRNYLSCERGDRRRNGSGGSRGLEWALAMRQV